MSTKPATQAYALTGSWTGNPSLCQTMPNQLRHTSHGKNESLLNNVWLCLALYAINSLRLLTDMCNQFVFTAILDAAGFNCIVLLFACFMSSLFSFFLNVKYIYLNKRMNSLYLFQNIRVHQIVSLKLVDMFKS